MKEKTSACSVVKVRDAASSQVPDVVVREEPLEILIGEKPFAVVMRTPGEEVALAVGLLLSEGVITGSADLRAVEYCQADNGNRVKVHLSPAALERAEPQLGRPVFLSKSSCGACGKEMLDDVSQHIRECALAVQLDCQTLFGLLEKTHSAQKVFAACGGTHAVALYNADGELVAFAEDVGRHNAMDKAIGLALLGRKLEEVVVCMASSRASFEMVQKAAAAGLPVLATVSAPSDLALELAERAGMTLIGFLRKGRMNIYTRADRIIAPPIANQ